MADEPQRWKKDEIERAAEERLRDIDGSKSDRAPDPGAGAFNPVEGVPPHGAGIPDEEK